MDLKTSATGEYYIQINYEDFQTATAISSRLKWASFTGLRMNLGTWDEDEAERRAAEIIRMIKEQQGG